MKIRISSDLTRRQILGWSGFGIFVGAAGYLGFPSGAQTTIASQPAGPKASPPQSPVNLPSQTSAGVLDRETFLPFLNSEFTLKPNPHHTADYKLVQVSPATVMKTEKGNFAAFTLLFKADSPFIATSSICHVSHPQLTDMEIFLAPVGDGKKHHLLEACFTLRA